ncbi:hypothetical protein J6590_077206 [Homalodisca vitripennis]|nr:hypothetical protein J6590_077206 [Homalodisca vitripennis]
MELPVEPCCPTDNRLQVNTCICVFLCPDTVLARGQTSTVVSIVGDNLLTTSLMKNENIIMAKRFQTSNRKSDRLQIHDQLLEGLAARKGKHVLQFLMKGPTMILIACLILPALEHCLHAQYM